MPKMCNNCPRCCISPDFFCSKDDDIKINLYQLHHGEEPPISGQNGSGTIFFCNCNLKCSYCQNYKISHQAMGYNINEDQFVNICFELQKQKAHNINLVTPTPYSDKILKALRRLKEENFCLPIVWNSSGYESLDMIRDFKGLVDIFLPDFKYSDSNLSYKLSAAENYSKIALDVIQEMRHQVQDVFDEKGIMQKGLIIRHLVLPSFIENSKKVLDIIKYNLGTDVYISLMSQYIPVYKSGEYEKINRVLKKTEYRNICDYFFEKGFANGFVQDLSSASEVYVPFFST